MRRTTFFLLIVLAALLPTAAADWIPLEPGAPAGTQPSIRVVACDAAATVVEITLPGFFADRTPEGYDLRVPGWPLTEAVGSPALPAAKFLVALPSAEVHPTLEAVVQDVRTFESFGVRLLPPPERDSAPAPAPAAPAPAPAPGLFPAQPCAAGTPGAIGALPVIAVKAYPFQVETRTNTLTAASRMIVTIRHDAGLSAWPAVPLTDTLARRCAAAVSNFSFVPRVRPNDRGGVRYLVITPASLQPAVEPLAEWRNKTGYRTEVRIPDSYTPAAIKNLIKEYANLDYVLLVGDHSDIPMAYWAFHFGDHWYACITGGGNPDPYADLCIGRLSGSTAAKITHQVDKILGYEKSPPLGDWLKTTILVAHGEQYPDKYTQCKNEIASFMAANSDWTVTKYYGGETGKTNAGLTQLINNPGVNLLNYRGHGGPQEWWSWNLYGESFTNNNVFALQNGDMQPVVLNIACDNADLTTDCLCEAWMDHTGGASAALGATEPSYTYPNHDFDKKLYDAFFAQDLTDIGSALNYADDYIIANWGGIGQDNAWMYLWLGDPAMKLWRVIPGAMTASFATNLPAGTQDFTVTVTANGSPVEGALVCCWKAGEVSKTGTTGSDGKATLSICPTTAGMLYVTVTHEAHLPFEGTATVAQGSLHCAPNEISTRNGGTVDFTLEAGTANAGRDYLLLGSVSGTVPGTVLPGGAAVLPLNFDAFTNLVIAYVNSPIFANFMGTLDGSGNGSAQLNAPAPGGAFLGLHMYFAYALNAPWDFASNAVTVEVVE